MTYQQGRCDSSARDVVSLVSEGYVVAHREGNMLHKYKTQQRGRCGNIGILASKMWFLGKDYVVVPQKDVAAHQGNLFLSTGDVVGQL